MSGDEYSWYEEVYSVNFLSDDDDDDYREKDVDHSIVNKVYKAALSGLEIDTNEINCRNDSGLTALMSAIQWKNIQAQKVLIQAGADLNISRSNRSFYTALSLAVDHRLSTTVKELLRRGPFLSCTNGIKALEMARARGFLCYVVEGENFQITQKKEKEMNGRTGVFQAFKENRLDLMSDLIKAGSYITLMHKSTYTESHNNKYLLQHLIEEGININMVFQEDCTPLTKAIEYESLICVDVLIKAKANVEFVTKNKLTTLHMAAEHVQDDIVKKLIEAGADVNAETCDCETPLHFAVRFVENKSQQFKVETDVCVDRDKIFQTLSYLLEAGAKVNVPNRSGLLPIVNIVEFGNLELLKLLIDHGADVNALDTKKNPVLTLALKNKSKKIASLLVQRGADVNVSSVDHVPCLLEAVWLGDVEIIKSIIQKGGDLKQTDADGNTCLHTAVYAKQDQDIAHSSSQIYSMFPGLQSTVFLQHHQYITKPVNDTNSTEVLRLLLDHKAEVNHADSKGRTVLHKCVENKQLEHVQLLLEAGADVNILNTDHETPLHIAASLLCCTNTKTDSNLSVEAKIFQALLVPEAKVNIADKDGNTVLHCVVQKENVDIVQSLVDAGADVQIRNNVGETVLHNASRNNSKEIMAFLLNMPHVLQVIDVKDGRLEFPSSKRRKLNSWKESNIYILYSNFTFVEDIIIQSTGKTALMLALEYECEEIAFKLLSCGADVDVHNDNGYTALHFAVFKSSTEIVRHLIHAGCKVNEQADDGDTPLMLARNKNIVNILIEAGAEINSKNVCGIKALHTAICRGDVESVDILICKGAVINEAAPELLPPLTLAACLEELKIINSLLKAGADVNKLSTSGVSSVMAAAANVTDFESDKSPVFQILHNHGADFNLTDNNGETALMYLIKHGFLEEYFDYFKRYGADLEITDHDGRSALAHCVLRECDYLRVTYSEILLRAGANPLVGVKCRHMLCKHELGSFNKRVWCFMKKEYRPTYEIIILFGHFDFLRLLICNGIVLKPSSPNRSFYCSRNPVVFTALVLSIQFEKVDVLKYLLATSYLTVDDLKYLQKLDIIVLNDRHFSTNNDWLSNAEILKMVKSANSQPWPLFKLAIIAVSTTLGESPERDERLSRIHLPPKLTRLLTFQTPIAKLPVRDWSKLSLF